MGLKIAIASSFSWPYVRRGNRFAHDLAAYLANNGHQIHFITTKPGRISRKKMQGRVTVDYHHLQVNPLLSRLNILKFETFALSCLNSFMREDYDIVQTISPPDGFAASINKFIKGTAFVHLLIAKPLYFPTKFGKLMLKQILRSASQLVVPSNFIQDVLKREFKMEGKIIPPAVDTEQFSVDARKEHNIPIILFTASLTDRRKRVDLLVKAFERLIEYIPNAVLQLSGHNSQTVNTDLLQSVTSKAREAIEILGVGRQEDLPALYRKASISVLPSIDEAFGAVITESLASGTPVVGTRTGAIPDIINDQRVGVLFEPTDGPQELCKALLKGLELAQDPLTPLRCSQHAQRYSWDTVGPQFEKLFFEILNNNQRKTFRTSKKKKREKQMKSAKASNQSKQFNAMTDKALLKKTFDDAIDDLEITIETYYEIAKYQPRCLFIANWLANNKIQKGSVLVVGAYPFPLTMFLEKLGFKVRGIAVAKKLEPWKEIKNLILFSDLENTVSDLPENYDLILCDDLLQYFEFPVRILQLLKEHLNPGAVFILTTMNSARGTTRFSLLFGRNIYPWLCDDIQNDGSSIEDIQKLIPYREYTLREVEKLALDSGHSIIDSQYVIGKKLIEGGIESLSFRSYFLRIIYYLVQKTIPSLRSHLFVAAERTSSENINPQGKCTV
jgi:glycosyltransferase involved in cell wall biosynthesis